MTATKTNGETAEVVKYDPTHPIVKAIVDGVVPEVVDSDAMSRAMALRILEASHDDAFNLQQATPIKELLTEVHSVNPDGTENRCTPPLQIRGVEWAKSDFDSNGGVYAIVDCAVVETGEHKVVTCGGRFVMAALYRLEMDGDFGGVYTAVEVGKPAPNRDRALRLVHPNR